MLPEKNVEITSERMKRKNQSKNSATCIPVADYVKFKNKIKFKIFKKKKQCPVVNVTGGGSKVQYFKSNIA